MAYETEIILDQNIVINNCPFCGCSPRATMDVRYPRNTEWSILHFAEKYNVAPDEVPSKVIAYEVACSNSECVIHNNTSKFYLSMDEAIGVWNTRVDNNVCKATDVMLKYEEIARVVITDAIKKDFELCMENDLFDCNNCSCKLGVDGCLFNHCARKQDN